MDQTVSIIFFLAAVLIVGGILFAVISFSKHSPKGLKKEYYQQQWLSIESQLKKDQASSFTLCVLNADKLLDKALKESGVKGETMGERMKNYQSKWSNSQNVWGAHKLRNRLAHETDVNINYDQSRRALAAFRQALKDTGAL